MSYEPNRILIRIMMLSLTALFAIDDPALPRAFRAR
jgi:hypothetical protein